MFYAFALAIVAQSIAYHFALHRVNVLHCQQVADLCQRLQAPETAVAQHVVRGPDFNTTPYLPFDDDTAWLKYQTDQVTDGDFG